MEEERGRARPLEQTNCTNDYKHPKKRTFGVWGKEDDMVVEILAKADEREALVVCLAELKGIPLL